MSVGESNDEEKRAVIFGAGNVGRGFLGQLFCESGYRVTFVDVVDDLIDALQCEGAYTLRMVTNQESREMRIGPVTAIHSGRQEAVCEAMAEASLAATAVGVRALPLVAPVVARAIARRASQGVNQPLNVIVCENLKGAAGVFHDMVAEHLDPQTIAYLERWVGFVNTVIGRMVPAVPEDVAAQDPSLVIVEPYKELPVERSGFVGEIPDVVGMQPRDNFGLYVARKLYIHNAGHAVLGYLGYQRGYELGYEALKDEGIAEILRGAMDESLAGIVAAYDALRDELEDHVRDLLERFANEVLADPVIRLARDPLRKLAPEDRLVGAARLAEEAGETPRHLAQGIAAALAYDMPEDAMAVTLQERIAQKGVAAVLKSVSEIDPDEALGRMVLEQYRRLRERG